MILIINLFFRVSLVFGVIMHITSCASLTLTFNVVVVVSFAIVSTFVSRFTNISFLNPFSIWCILVAFELKSMDLTLYLQSSNSKRWILQTWVVLQLLFHRCTFVFLEAKELLQPFIFIYWFVARWINLFIVILVVIDVFVRIWRITRFKCSQFFLRVFLQQHALILIIHAIILIVVEWTPFCNIIGSIFFIRWWRHNSFSIFPFDLPCWGFKVKILFFFITQRDFSLKESLMTMLLFISLHSIYFYSTLQIKLIN